jgi:hypothetical protein
MKSYRNIEEAIRDQHSPQDAERILALWEEANRGEPEDMAEAMTELVCKGTIVLSLDEEGQLVARMPHPGN